MNNNIDHNKYDFIWRMYGWTYLQNCFWADKNYRSHDFILTGERDEWVTYLGKKDRANLSKLGIQIIKNIQEYESQVDINLTYAKEKFNYLDKLNPEKLSNQELKQIIKELETCGHKLIDVYFKTEFFVHDATQAKINQLGLNLPEYLTSSPLENIITKEKYERYILALDTSEQNIEKFIAKYDFVPFSDRKPAWDKTSLLEDLALIDKSQAKKEIESIEQQHNNILSARKHHPLTDGARRLQELKFMIRIYFNKLYLEGNILDKFLYEIARRQNTKIEDLHTCSIQEIFDLLYNNEIPNKDRTYYVVGKFNNWDEIIGRDAKIIIEELKRVEDHSVNEITGQIGCRGYYKGIVKVIPLSTSNETIRLMKEMKEGEVLVAGSTGPEMILACKKASAIVTEEGGICSHASIISRELNIPCIVGTKIATKVLKDGDIIEVDANKGIVKKL